jgi:hypothetical protein
MNSHYFVINILTLLEQSTFRQGRVPHEKRLVVHVDNCSLHTGRVSRKWPNQHNIVHMPQPPYSPDLAPSHFYSFLTVIEKLQNIALRDEDQLFECLIEIAAGLDQTELNRVFHAWKERVRQVREGTGDYIG